LDALLAIIDRTYEEFDRERHLNDRAAKLMEEELRAANKQAQREHDSILAAILKKASDGMLVTRESGVIETANTAAELQFGAPAGGLTGQPLRRFLPDIGETAAASPGGADTDAARESTARTFDGRTFPVEFSASVLETGGGFRQLWTVRDITERMRAQRDIVETRMRFQDFAEASSDYFWEMDASLTRVTAQGGTQDELAAKLPFMLAPPGGTPMPGLSPESWVEIRRNLTARQPFRDLRLALKENSSALYVSLSGKPVFDLDGRFRGYRGTGRDITREILAQEAAHRAERRLIEAMDGAPSAIALVDWRLNLVSGNSALEELAPGKGEQLDIGRPFPAFLASVLDERSGLREDEMTPSDFINSLIKSGDTREVKIGDRWHLVAARRLSDGGAVFNFSDITTLKAREGELAEAKAAAEAASHFKSQFLATMSHELRTPLNAILGFSEVIRDGVFGAGDSAWPKYMQYAGSIHSSGRHLLSLISEILDLSKIEAGSYVLDIETLDLRDTVTSACAIMSPAAQKGEVTLDWQPPEDPVWVAVDDRALRQITLNLMANAVKFTPAEGRVILKVRTLGSTVELLVSDTGVGIAPEDHGKVFQLFRQVDSSIRRRHEGTGLGLAITKKLVDLHGGDISFDSELGRGTTMRVRLPLAHAPAQEKNERMLEKAAG
jgi:PAS domain S-box-containing protein